MKRTHSMKCVPFFWNGAEVFCADYVICRIHFGEKRMN